MKAYKLLRDVPGLPAGSIFLHDKKDSTKGSIGCGCLKNAWKDGNCQPCTDNDDHVGWCAETHVFPGQLAKDKNWFKRIKNKKKQYYLKHT